MAAWNDLSEEERAAILQGNVRARRMITVVLLVIVLAPALFFVIPSWLQTRWTGAQWLEKATHEAKSWAPDAELVSIHGVSVDAAGFADIRGRGSWRFRFRSPSREAQARATHEPKGIPGAPPPPPTSPSCSFEYDVFAGMRGGFMTDTTERHLSDGCGASLPSAPRCTITQVMDRAATRGAPRPAFAHVMLETHGDARTWAFEIPNFGTTIGGDPVFKASFADDCP